VGVSLSKPPSNPNNLLLAVVSFGGDNTSNSIPPTPPNWLQNQAGFFLLANNTPNNVSLAVYTKYAGNDTSVTFTGLEGGGAEYYSVALYEITGGYHPKAPFVFDQSFGYSHSISRVTTFQGNNVTTQLNGCLPLTFVATDTATLVNETTGTWTVDGSTGTTNGGMTLTALHANYNTSAANNGTQVAFRFSQSVYVAVVTLFLQPAIPPTNSPLYFQNQRLWGYFSECDTGDFDSQHSYGPDFNIVSTGMRGTAGYWNDPVPPATPDSPSIYAYYYQYANNTDSLHVVHKILLDPNCTGSPLGWRASIDPGSANIVGWMNQYYLNYMLPFAPNSDVINIYTELIFLAQNYPNAWVWLCQMLRQSGFDGILTSSANSWNEMPYEMAFALDWVGFEGYPGVDTSSLDNARNSWAGFASGAVTAAYNLYGKPIFFGEWGYINSCNYLADDQLSNYLWGMTESLCPLPYFRGGAYWNWNQQQSGNSDFNTIYYNASNSCNYSPTPSISLTGTSSLTLVTQTPSKSLHPTLSTSASETVGFSASNSRLPSFSVTASPSLAASASGTAQATILQPPASAPAASATSTLSKTAVTHSATRSDTVSRKA
jgi:hypothetical protein